MSSPRTFTASQIAAALGKVPRLIRRALDGVAKDDERNVRGNITETWKLSSLPESLQKELDSARQRRGLATVEALFADAQPWQPEIIWREVCNEQQTEALKLQRALLPILERHQSPILDGSELVEIGLRNYRQEFGEEISADKLRYLFNRTLDRDRGLVQFHRPEIFLPGNLKRAGGARVATGNAAEFESLNDCLALFANPLSPTIQEKDALWIAVVELFRETQTDRPKKFKRRLLNFLWTRAPFLASSFHALRVNFDRKTKLVEAQQGETLALLDGRHLKRGETRAAAVPQTDVDRLVWHSAKNCGGRTAQAVRELGQLGDRSGLSAETLALINAPHKSKSHVNRRLHSIVHRDAQLIAPHLLGKKAVDDATPSLRRDYSKQRSMDVLTADDFTMPVYFFIKDGKGWWNLTRGQCLLMIDCRSLRILAFSLQPERNYNSLVIRTLMNRTCQERGLPRAWLFENGIWKNSRVVKGPPREWSNGKSWAEYKPGWERLGVRFIHAKKARSKPAELVGGLLQNLMERMPGYCGRDERRDCPEVTKRNKLAVEAGRIEPHGLFLSFDAWEAELSKLIDAYNANIQQGEILQGMSPDQAFEAHWPHDDPPTEFDASCWHLLAHYVSEREVKANGIEFRIGSEHYIYRDENSTALRLRKVLAWFDPDCADVLGVTDLSGRNPVLVKRESKVDFLASLDRDGESGREYQEELRKVAAHNAYPKARFNVLKLKFSPTFRRNVVAPGVAHVADTFAAGRKKLQDGHQAESRRRSKVASRARELGSNIAAVVRNADPKRLYDVDAGTEMMKRADSAEAAAVAAKPTSGKKDYFLKPFGDEKRQYVEYLVNRLTEFRAAGSSFGQKFGGTVSKASVTRIARSQLGFDIYDATRFDEVCDHLKTKIDATILGKRNVAKGSANYHEFASEPTGGQKT